MLTDLTPGTAGKIEYQCWQCGMQIYGDAEHHCGPREYYQITPDYSSVLGRIANALETLVRLRTDNQL